MNKDRNEKKNIRNCNWSTKLKKKNLYKRNKNEIRNQKNDDWNWKIKNKKDNHALYLGGERKKKTTDNNPTTICRHVSNHKKEDTMMLSKT